MEKAQLEVSKEVLNQDHAALLKKIVLMQNFFKTQRYKKLSNKQKYFLNAQFGAMKSYYFILTLRLLEE